MNTQLGPIDMLLIFGGIVSRILLIAFTYLGIMIIVDKLMTVPYGKFTIGLIVFWFIVGGIYDQSSRKPTALAVG
jgi:uncharacterized membrane protein (DUF485 family)